MPDAPPPTYTSPPVDYTAALVRNLVFACLASLLLCLTPALGDTVTGVAPIGNDLAFNVTGADMGAYTAWPMYVSFIAPWSRRRSPPCRPIMAWAP